MKPATPRVSDDRARLRAGRVSVAVAAALVLIGALRFATDTLHELDPEYWRALEGGPLRYLVRAPSDGSLAGELNAQFFKLLAMPAGLGLVWLGYRFGSGTLETKAAQFRDPVIRAVWLGSFLAGFTLIELEKQFHMLGMGTMMLEGERAWLNHVIHVVGFGLAWMLGSVLAFEPLRQGELELERELDALVSQAEAKP
ncbi:hypothetical protein PPSIR1_24369 [Plesiocystis pacifica SIR-1]|uniref:Uncharacterized protein n=1 Tax=Plesiocystis pacifica SIR-1 TaxID=391625 RepID=A6GC38_9BACT|nr:hypothetical protein [Plesiocystis pacifica]EDM76600.1 hypothetical protein PPSIR1_24369 [Plesiocystis pacifica SIR-1]